MTETPGGSGSTSAEQEAIMAQLNADHDWLASQGAVLSQWGPDPGSGKVRVYLAHFTQAAQQLLSERYGPAIVVDTESRQWRSRA
jgi:hypothetical protein